MPASLTAAAQSLGLTGAGIARLSDPMRNADRAEGRLVEVLAMDTLDIRHPINAAYYRNTSVSARITPFLDDLAEAMGVAWRHASGLAYCRA
ncbi:MAG: hypothetical protein ABWX87_10565 [Pseudoxanthomonas sp.]